MPPAEHACTCILCIMCMAVNQCKNRILFFEKLYGFSFSLIFVFVQRLIRILKESIYILSRHVMEQ